MDNIEFQPPRQFSVNCRPNISGGQIKSLQLKEDPPARQNSAALKKACSEMESLFIDYLFKEMRSTIPKSELINGGKGEEIYLSMLDSQLSKELASKGGIGLSSAIYNQLIEKAGTLKTMNYNEPEQKAKHEQLKVKGF
jgi:peptidoglycan hydrolase FlgJ